MILLVDWTQFQLKWLQADTVYVKEDDSNWIFLTNDNHFFIKCVVDKSANTEENIMFVERYLQGGNIIKVMDIIGEEEEAYNETIGEESSTQSDGAIREEDEVGLEPVGDNLE